MEHRAPPTFDDQPLTLSHSLSPALFSPHSLSPFIPHTSSSSPARALSSGGDVSARCQCQATNLTPYRPTYPGTSWWAETRHDIWQMIDMVGTLHDDRSSEARIGAYEPLEKFTSTSTW